MRTFGAIVFAFLLGLASEPALAEKRVALVIGNSAYENVSRLANPANDASAITAALKEAGFEVLDSRRNLKIADMRRAFRDFADKARDADIAVVFYAGHGIEIDGTNYLIPVDAALERDLDIYDEAFSLDRILISIEPAKQLRLVMLDACRDNPFAKTMKRTIGSRAIGRGLAKVEPTSPNTLIAFASKAGSTASDGDSKNSPFTAALVKHIATPGLDLRKAFGYVRDEVLKNTSNKQEPYVYGSLGGDDLSLVPAKPGTAQPAPSDHDATMRRDYEFADRVGTKPVWDAFIERYPSGFFTALAKAQRDKLAAEESRVAATEKARLAQEEKARLASEGAKQAAQAKAAEEAKAAERARIAAELAKQAQEAKVAEAERAKAAAQAKAAEEAKAAEAAKAAKAQAEAERVKAAEAAKRAAEEKAAADRGTREEKVAALSSADQKTESASVDLPRALQAELRRVGCNTGAVDGNWNTASQRALELFNRHAGMKLEAKTASADALDAIKAKTSRVCPLVCDHGLRADGDRCVKIACHAGYRINDDNECEKVPEKKPVAKREDSKPKQDAVRKEAESASPKPQASEQIICKQGSCRPVAKGCRLAPIKMNGYSAGMGEVCN